MSARVITTQTSPGKLADAIQLWRESVAPSVKQQKGFKRAYLLVERATGKIRTIGLWETEADLQASVGWYQEQIAVAYLLLRVEKKGEKRQKQRS